MKISVLYFGVLRESFGGESDAVVLGEGATVADLVARVKGSRVGGVWGALAVAVNREYARRETVLKDGDEVALLPPVSGGAWERPTSQKREVGQSGPAEICGEVA